MHCLAAWLKAKEISPAEFARRILVSRATLSRLLSGKRAPSLGLVDKIEAATDGELTANHLLASYRAIRQDGPTVAAPVEAVP